MKNSIKYILYKTKLLNLFYMLFYIFPVRNNKVICSNFDNKGYGDSPRYIVEEILKKRPDAKILWICNKKDLLPDNIQQVKPYSLKYFYELATSKIWIFNTRKKIFIKKRKNQFYVQTWHGCIAMKKIEKDCEDKLDKVYLLHSKTDSKDIDLFVSSNKVFSEQIKRSFEYNGKIIEYGTPKNDILVNNKNKDEKYKKIIYEKFNIKNNTKIVLYAPTFRDVESNYKYKPYDINLNEVIKKLEKQTNSEWNAIVRLHPKLKDKELLQYDSEKIIYKNTTNIDISELVLGSDLIITDYSSVMFDGMIAEKHVMLYTKDYNEYYKNRGCYFSLDDLPFKYGINNRDFINKINYYDNYIEKYSKFEKNIALNETGNSSKKIASIITEKMYE